MAQNSTPNSVVSGVHPVMAAAIAPHLKVASSVLKQAGIRPTALQPGTTLDQALADGIGHAVNGTKPRTHAVPMGVQEAEGSRRVKFKTRQVTSTQDVQHATHRAIDDLMGNVVSPWAKIGTITLAVMPETYDADTDQVTRPLMVEASATVTMRIWGTGQPDRR